MKTVSWFSAGVSSAVATKLVVDSIDEIIYVDIEDQHPDSIRFVRDCEEWFGKKITILRSPYKNVESVCEAFNFIAGPRQSPICSRILKKRTRKEWELQYEKIPLTYFWGLDLKEEKRREGICKSMPKQSHRFPLIEEGMDKQKAHQVLMASGIKRPFMYDLGYHNNNCIGCVQGGMGYWNKIRIDFPDVFKKRAKMERKIGASCRNGVYLDTLDSERGRKQEPICPECGILCEEMSL